MRSNGEDSVYPTNELIAGHFFSSKHKDQVCISVYMQYMLYLVQ